MQFTEKSRSVKVGGECATANLRMDVSYEQDGMTGNVKNINGQVYRKANSAYVGNFNVTYNGGVPNHSFNIGDNLDVLAEMVQAIVELEQMIAPVDNSSEE